MDKRFLRRDFIRRSLIGSGYLALTGTNILAPLVHAFGNIPEELPPGQSIYDMGGEVYVDGQLADKSTFISAQSLVETGSNSFVIFVVGKDAHILRENSRLQLEGETSIIETGLRLFTGKLLSVFGKRSSNESHTIKTSTATIGIRGTGIYTESDPDVSYVCTCYGHVDLLANTDQQSSETIISEHHDAPRYILADGNAGKLITPAPFKNHSDEELMLIEAITGRTPPFSSVMGYSSPRRGY
ncbi:hypothetical protein ACFOEK_07295 [Litoribrevibacter euphylliae]|uniref:FecR protein domain-containing protein n=1 Tax=Litoribrevibacter euphylliae TaxID=1834034 RepID=A0ABV7HAL9_9GAMM